MVYEFRYLAPRTAAELAAVLDGHKEDGKLLAGGPTSSPVSVTAS